MPLTIRAWRVSSLRALFSHRVACASISGLSGFQATLALTLSFALSKSLPTVVPVGL